MNRAPFRGRRLPDAVVPAHDPQKWHPDPAVTPRAGDFWKVRQPTETPENGWWVYVPNGRPLHVLASLVTEHGDGTVTLRLPVVEAQTGAAWDLVRGEWRPR